jgi:hypothetical protein
MATADEDGCSAELTPVARRAVRLLLSRMVGEVKGRHVAPQICRLVGEAFAVPGPWPDEEYSLHACGCEWDEIAARWSVASGAGTPLADEITSAFFPRKIWPALWQVVSLGPVAATRRVEATLQAAGHGLTLEGNPRSNGPLSAVTVDGLSASFGRLARAAIELRKDSLDPSLALDLPAAFGAWTQDALPKRRTAFELGARQWRRNNTKAVRLRLTRLTLQALNGHIERNGRPSYRLGLHLRNRVLIGILALGPRIGTVVALDVRDYDAAHEFPDGVVGPALHFRKLKGLPGIARWRGIPPLLALWIEEYHQYYGVASLPTAPFWVTKRADGRQLARPTAVTLTAAAIAAVGRVQPPDDGRLYRPHSHRHLAEQVCFDAALDYLTENRRHLLHDENGRGLPANPQVLCDCLLDHALHDISDRYKDINNEDGREVWGRFAANLVWDYVWGEKGARTIPDLARLRASRASLGRLLADEATIKARIREREGNRDSTQVEADERLQRVLDQLASLDNEAKWLAHFEQLAAMRQIASIDKQINADALRLVELAREIALAARAVDEAHSLRMPVSDALADEEIGELLAFTSPAPTADHRPTRRVSGTQFISALGGGLTESQLRQLIERRSRLGHLFDRAADGSGRGVTTDADGELQIDLDEIPIERYPHAVVRRLFTEAHLSTAALGTRPGVR